MSAPTTDANAQILPGVNRDNRLSHLDASRLEKQHDAMMVVLLLFGVACDAILAPPEGCWSEDFTGVGEKKNHTAGSHVMATQYPDTYSEYILLNTTSMLCSSTAIFLLATRLALVRISLNWLVILLIHSSISTIGNVISIDVTYANKDGVVNYIADMIMIWLMVMSIIFIVYSLNLIYHLRGRLNAVVYYKLGIVLLYAWLGPSFGVAGADWMTKVNITLKIASLVLMLAIPITKLIIWVTS